MTQDGHHLPRVLLGDAFIVAEADNTNWRLMPDWMTPAELTQWINRRKERLRRELAVDFRLRSCPEHRLTWEITLAMERCAMWQVHGVRTCDDGR
jgi:hypothetical protein